MLRTVSVALILLLGAALAGAAPAADEQQARQLFDRGETQYRLGNFAEALSNYEAALKLRRHPSIIFNIAQCYRQLGKTQRAIFFYKLFISDWERENPDSVPPHLEEVQEHIERLSARLEAAEQASAESGGQADGAKQRRIVGHDLASEERAPAGDHDGGRPRLWMSSGIATGVLAAGALGLGVGLDIKANRTEGGEGYARARNLSITGYVLTGVFAAASAASWTLYCLSARTAASPGAAALVVPTPGGALVVTSPLRF